jgi:hypothetical protein
MSGRRASRRRRIKGKLIGTHCDGCGEPLMFVASNEGWELSNNARCPCCAGLAVPAASALSINDQLTLATRVLLVAFQLRRLADPDESISEAELAAGCNESATQLQDISTHLVPTRHED